MPCLITGEQRLIDDGIQYTFAFSTIHEQAEYLGRPCETVYLKLYIVSSRLLAYLRVLGLGLSCLSRLGSIAWHADHRKLERHQFLELNMVNMDIFSMIPLFTEGVDK